MKDKSSTSKSNSSFSILFILLLCLMVSVSILFSRVIPYSTAKFVNVYSLIDNDAMDTELSNSVAPASEKNPSISTGESNTSSNQNLKGNPEFKMETEAEIFRVSYDNDSGEITVIGNEDNTDKLIAPGTSNLYQFTLANTGDVSLDYIMTMEAYVTGTDIKIPVNVRVWDYTNKYLIGSTSDMVDVMELNTVEESGELGAGRYAVYNLEWEWPFEWGNDEYDTMLGNLAENDDLVLTIVIRTIAEYDEEPENPETGLIRPTQTGDDTQPMIFILLGGVSFAGLCGIFFTTFQSKRKEKQAE